MENYIKYISLLSKNGTNEEFSNCDEDHALEVLVRIFDISKEYIRIFAGSLCSGVPNNPRYIAALSDFIERDGKVRILVNEYELDKAKESNLFKRLAYYASQDKDIHVSRTSAAPYLSGNPSKKVVHFTIGDDKAYRIETDTEKRAATCNFNDPERAKEFISLFQIMENESASSNIDLKQLNID